MADPTPAMAPVVLAVAGVTVHFEGVVALDGVALQVDANQIVGVIGPNGAGKTTLFNAISRFVTPASGTITFNGNSLLDTPAWRLAHIGIARTLQGLGLWPSLTVRENVVGGAPSRTRVAADMLAFPSADRHRKALIARALMARPELLLLDEPASGLSASDVTELIALLRTLRGRMAIALVEHHVDMVMAVSDTITVLNLGRVIASGTPDAIRANSDV